MKTVNEKKSDSGKWECIVWITIAVVIGTTTIVGNAIDEHTKQVAIQAIENGADTDTVNRILGK